MVEAIQIEQPWIGIDLGTTNSCVALWTETKIEIIQNPDDGKNTTPSVVAYKKNDGDILVGSTAVKQSGRNLANTIYDAKRLVGRKFDDPMVSIDQEHWPFKLVCSDENKPLIQVA